MRRMTLTLAVGALWFAGSVLAQIPPPSQNPPPTQTPPPKPTPPPPVIAPPPGTGTQTQKPDAPAAPKLPTPVPFPADAKVAFVDLQRVVNDSKLGKSGLDQMKGLKDKLNQALQEQAKKIQALEEKIKSQQSVASETTINSWGKELDRLRREGQFMQEDAQVQEEQMQRELLGTFQVKVLPIVEAIRNEKGLWIVFQLGDGSPIIAAHAGLDLTAEVVKRLDAGK
jgi:outer membrane protein